MSLYGDPPLPFYPQRIQRGTVVAADSIVGKGIMRLFGNSVCIFQQAIAQGGLPVV